MTDLILFFFILLLLASIIYYLYIKNIHKTLLGFFKKENKSPSPHHDHDEVHIRKKHKHSVITLEESWKFLTEIADVIKNNFSKSDQISLLDIGKKLTKLGLTYNHVIEYGVKHNESPHHKGDDHHTDNHNITH